MFTGWLDVHTGSFAPALAFVLCDSEYARYSATALSLGRYGSL
jgi:hypothetical protein